MADPRWPVLQSSPAGTSALKFTNLLSRLVDEVGLFRLHRISSKRSLPPARLVKKAGIYSVPPFLGGLAYPTYECTHISPVFSASTANIAGTYPLRSLRGPIPAREREYQS
jgi:hypothetical protein